MIVRSFQVRIVKCRGIVKAPFKADFKIGFDSNFDVGTQAWQDSGNYVGIDETNVKMVVNLERFTPTRKVSKMLNGLGDDM